MKRFAWVLALVFLLGSTSMSAQGAGRADPCEASPAKGSAAAKNFLTFDQFDKELRVALERQDALALAFLVKFPLRVNDAGGSISLDDAAALKTHFQEVFTPAVLKELLSAKEEPSCNVEGIMYGRGLIWVNASSRGYAIEVVNRDSIPPYPGNQWDTPGINYVCQTQTHRIVVDTLKGGILRYRSWNKPRPVTDAPDLEITKGDGSFEGTNVCAYPTYTFKNGTAVYRVDGAIGCDSDAPKEATGRLEVTLGDKPTADSWCY